MRLESLQRSMLENIVGCPTGKLSEELSTHLEYGLRFHIYQSGYRVRILASLEETFPKSLAAVGQNSDIDFVEDFISHSRFASFDLFGICDSFPAFVKTHQPWAGLHFLPELARAELECARSFHKPSRSTCSFAEIAAQLSADASLVRLRLQPYVGLFESPYNIVALINGTDNQKPQGGRLFYHLIRRQNGETRVECVSDLEAAFLKLLQDTSAFEEACERLERQIQMMGRGEDVVPVAEWIWRWADMGMFVSEVDHEW